VPTRNTQCSQLVKHIFVPCCCLNRRGRALSLKGNYEEAEADFHRAATIDPFCAADMEKEVVANQQRARAADRKQRSEMKNFLSRRG
jgi:hypothetical protein